MDSTICDLLNQQLTATPTAVAHRSRVAPGEWREVTWSAQIESARRLAKSLIVAGVARGDRVVIVGRTRPEWQIAEWAIYFAGGTVVGIDLETPRDQMRSLLARLSPRALCAIGTAAAEVIDQIELKDGVVRFLIGQTRGGHSQWRDGESAADPRIELPVVSPDDVATLILTSGTTGTPKAIKYSHHQLMIACRAIVNAFPAVNRGDPLLCWLPLSHLFQRMMNLAVASQGGVVHFVDSPQTVIECLREVNPTIFCGVPRFFEKLVATIEERSAHRRPLARKSVRRILDGATARPPLASRVFDRIVRRRLRNILGRRVKYLVTGGAALAPSVAEKLANIGWEILEAYGISENAVPMSANRPGAARFGSVGIPLSENEIRLADDGEVLVRGPGVTCGYWPDGAPHATGDGFIRTGDLGRFDDEGYLYLHGRKSEIIKTSTGRKIHPAAVASVYERHPLIETVIAFGDDKPCLAALVVPNNRELVLRAGNTPGSDCTTPNDGLVERLVSQALDEMASLLPPHERLAKFRVLKRPLSVETGELTASLKICRAVIAKRYADEIACMFAEVSVSRPSNALDAMLA